MNEAKLKACPFCGGDAESDTTQGFRRMMDGAISKAVAIYCLRCTAQITMCHDDHKEYAPEDMLTILTDAWNIRAGAREPEAAPTAGNIAGSISANGSVPPETKALMWISTAQRDITKASGGQHATHLHNAKAALWNAHQLIEDVLALNKQLSNLDQMP